MAQATAIKPASGGAPEQVAGGRSKSARWDIQGLRAFAVLAVVLDHLWQWPRGGFVGVDIFFVISGFLITGLLVREHDRTGHISFVDFYRRRIKRIIPAATLVLVATAVAATLTFNSVRAESIRGDAWWAFLFSANWRMRATETDYFDAAGAVSPLQHYWSLSVEEQFYFVWPWLMLLIFAVLVRGSRSAKFARGVVFATITAATIASFLWAMYETSTNPAGAYFNSFSRVWELGIGAMCAVALPVLVRIPEAIRPLLAWMGLAGMVASLWLVDPSVGFPAPWAALPVLSTALVIAAGSFRDHKRQQRYFWPITSRPANYVGDISYSLYLWHFPVIVIGTAWIGDSVGASIVLVAAMLTLSVFAYHLVEDPIRRSILLEPDSGRLRRRHGWGAMFPDLGESWRYIGVAFLTVVVAALAVAALQPVDPPRSITVTAPVDREEGDPTDGEPDVGPEQAALSEEIASALSLTTWPDMEPSMEEAFESRPPPPDVVDCGLGPVDLAACTFGPADATRTAVVVGDSIGMSFVEAIRNALPTWSVVTEAGYGCPFLSVQTFNADSELTAACPARNDAAVDAINDLRPDLVLVVNGYGPRTEVGADSPMTSAEWKAANREIIDRFDDAVGTIAFVSSPPYGVNPQECYTPSSVPADCVARPNSDWTDRLLAEQDLAEEDGHVLVDSRSLFCVEDYCPAVVGTTPVKVDGVHITQWYAAKIAPAMRELLQTYGLLKKRA